MKKIYWDIRLFMAVWLTITGFLVTITAFTSVYKRHFYLPYPEAVSISEEVLVENKKVSFIAVGDIMLSRNVARHSEKWWSPEWIWYNIGDYLREADFVFGNLEWTTNGTSIYSYQKVLIFNALPELINTLPGVWFGILNLANNHALDQWVKGLEITRELLSQIGIDQVGTGKNKDEAWEPTIITRNDIRIAFIGASYASYNDNGTGISPHVARMQETTRLIEAIQKAKEISDIIIVTMHAGQEYTLKTTPLQESFARTAIDNGADIVIGAHPHWIQPIERYKEKYIFYSLGNFVFDQDFSPETKTGLTLKIFITKNTNETEIEKIELHPIIIENYGQPRKVTEEEKISILSNIQENSAILLPLWKN